MLLGLVTGEVTRYNTVEVKFTISNWNKLFPMEVDVIYLVMSNSILLLHGI